MFQPDQVGILSSVLDKAAVVAAGLSIALDEAEELLRGAEMFVRSAATDLAQQRFVLSFRLNKTGTTRITGQELLKAISSKQPVMQVSKSLAIISQDVGDTTLTGSIARTEANKLLELVWHEGTLHYVMGGRLIFDERILPAFVPTSESQKWHRSFAQFTLIIDDHMEGAVQYERLLRYWADKKKRTLLVGPDGTERLFHQVLYWW